MSFCITEAVFGRALSWIITTPQLSMPHHLFWIVRHNFASVSQQTPALIVQPWGNKSTSRIPFLSQNTVHMIFQVDVICLNFVTVGDEECLHSMDCCFNLGVACDTHVMSPVTTWLKKLSPSSMYHVRKSNALAYRFNLCSSVSIFGTRHAHNFRDWSLSDTVLWRSDHEIWGKCRERDVMVNCLFSLIFSSTACTKSSFTTDSQLLRGSSSTFLCPSLNSSTHLHTIELLLACSPHVTKLTNFSRFHVLCIQERLQTAFHMQQDSLFS